MLRNYFRALYSDNGVLTDVSEDLQDAGDGLEALLTPNQDYFYIGQQMPFNNVFAWMDSPSDSGTATQLSVEYWDGSNFRACVEVLDGTKGFSKTGCIQFVPNKNYNWAVVPDTSETPDNFPTILKALKIYDLYWIRIKSSTILSAGTKFKRLTYAFCLSSDLSKSMPEVDNYLESWGGEDKSDWIREIIDASEQVVIDLKGKGLIVHPGQILYLDDVSFATRVKTISNIMSELGPAFAERRDKMDQDYRSAMSIKRFSLDVNKTGRLEEFEQNLSVGQLER